MDTQQKYEESGEERSSVQPWDECETTQQESEDLLLQKENQRRSQSRLEQHDVRRNLWRGYYEDRNDHGRESCPSEISAAVEYDLLKKAWKSFSDASEDNQNANFTNKASTLEWEENITIDELKDCVRSLADTLDQSHGKTRRYFDKFCSTLSSHSAILEVLPNQSQYLSIFCGVVKIILKASDNYRKTLEGLGEALAEIGDIVHLAVQHAKLVDTVDMRDAVIQLYESVFRFLREAMLWYKGKRLHRLRKSFDQNFYDHFSDLLDKIKRRADRIHIKGGIGHHAKTTDNIRITTSLDQKLDRIIITQEEDRRRFRELRLSRSAAFSSALPSPLTTMKGYTEVASLIGLHDAERMSIPMVSKTTELLNQSQYRRQFSKSELEKISRGLEAHIITPLSYTDTIDSGPLHFENRIIYAIRDWSAASGSGILRIGAAFQAGFPSVTSEISASVAKSAFENQLPSVYLCCNSLPKRAGRSIISTLYSFIHQLIHQIEFSSGVVDFNTSRIQELDGTIGTWNKAISICSDLLAYAPSTLLVIIDGIEYFDGDISEEYIDALINLLQDRATTQDLRGRTGPLLKVLFTTSGPCTSLNKLGDDILNTVNIKRQNTKRRPGESRLGRSPIQLVIGKQED